LATTAYSSWTLDGSYWMVADINRTAISIWSTDTRGRCSWGMEMALQRGTTFPSTMCQGYDTTAYQAAIADVNGDGKPDIVITCSEYSIVYTLLVRNGNVFDWSDHELFCSIGERWNWRVCLG